MYKIVMYAGKTEMDFIGDFDTYEEAEEICKSYEWVYYDENDFEWDLDIEED